VIDRGKETMVITHFESIKAKKTIPSSWVLWEGIYERNTGM
jgi:hypothetical protein